MKKLRNIIENVLLENKISDLSTNIEVDFELWKDPRHGGAHMKDRKARHGRDEYIYDYDIKKLMDDAAKHIAYSIYDGDIRNRKRFVVSRDGGDWLNAVVEPQSKEDGTWLLIVVTVMKEEYFNVRNQIQIKV